jgi:hypothetical protein
MATGSRQLIESFSLEFEELLSEFRWRRWTLIRWGPVDAPRLMAAMYKWQACADVFILRSEHEATAYRVPTLDDTGVFNPTTVAYQYHHSALWTLRAILLLPAPGEPGAPVGIETPKHPECFISEDLSRPVLIRPLSPYPG